MSPYVLLALAYVTGATPTSYLVGKGVYGTDLRTEGSGNLGGTNAFRVLGWKAALPVIVVDILKGWFPVWYFPQIHGDAPWTWALAYGGAAIVGHVSSFWVGFKGGKGDRHQRRRIHCGGAHGASRGSSDLVDGGDWRRASLPWPR